MARKKRKEKGAHYQGGIHRLKDGRLEVYLVNRRTTLKKDTPDQAGYRLLNKWRSELDDGTFLPTDADRITVGEYLDKWLAGIKGTVARHTYRDYESKVRLHLKPRLGKIKLKYLKAGDLQKLYGDLSETLSPRSVGYVHTTISKALNQAEAWDYVSKNVARHAKPPAKVHSERKVLTADEVKRFFEFARGDRFEALYVLTLTTGLRRGEVLGLKWADIDLVRGRLRIVRSLDDSQSPPIEKALKQDSSKRSVRLLPEAVAALEAHRKQQLEHRLMMGPKWTDNDYVFPSIYGTSMSGDNLRRRYLQPLLERAGLPKLTFHELRHTFATLMLSEGEHMKIVQSLLGHASIVQTMDTYSHVHESMRGDAVERLRDHLFGEN